MQYNRSSGIVKKIPLLISDLLQLNDKSDKLYVRSRRTAYNGERGVKRGVDTCLSTGEGRGGIEAGIGDIFCYKSKAHIIYVPPHALGVTAG